MTATGEEIYLKYRDKVRGYISSRISRTEDVEDLVSDVFEKVFRSLDSFDEGKASISTWIYTITRNTVIDYFRKNTAYSELPEELPSRDLVETSLLREETLGELAAALNTLPQDQKDIIVLRYFMNYPMTEIAKKMDLNYGVAKYKHQQALEKLRKALKA